MPGDAAIPEEMLDIDMHPVLSAAKILVVENTPADLVAAETALAPVNRQLVTVTRSHEIRPAA